jgi:hypothetical protein
MVRESAKELVHKLAPLGKESAEYSSAPLRFKRMVKPPIRGQPTGFFCDSDDEQPPKGPTIASLSASNKSMCKSIRKANDRLTESLLKIKYLSDEINELCWGFAKKIARVARAVGVADALNEPF